MRTFFGEKRKGAGEHEGRKKGGRKSHQIFHPLSRIVFLSPPPFSTIVFCYLQACFFPVEVGFELVNLDGEWRPSCQIENQGRVSDEGECVNG
jgi:hypothetical protein